jgi:hypothetical protein
VHTTGTFLLETTPLFKNDDGLLLFCFQPFLPNKVVVVVVVVVVVLVDDVLLGAKQLDDSLGTVRFAVDDENNEEPTLKAWLVVAIRQTSSKSMQDIIMTRSRRYSSKYNIWWWWMAME